MCVTPDHVKKKTILTLYSSQKRRNRWFPFS